MGDFAGGTLKYLRDHPIARVTIAGGPAKMAKLAQGRLDLHSKRGAVDLEALAERVAEVGGAASLAEAIASANSGLHAFELAQAAGFDLAALVAEGAWRRRRASSPGRRRSSRSSSSAATGGCSRAADSGGRSADPSPLRRDGGASRWTFIHALSARAGAEAAHIVGVVELALAKILGAERRADEDERRALDRRGASAATSVAEGRAHDALVRPRGPLRPPPPDNRRRRMA